MAAKAWQRDRVPVTQIDDVRSYMFEIETKEVLHIDRLGADDVVRSIEKLAVTKSVWVWADEGMISIKLANWKIKVMRDAVVVNAGDYVLVADDRFLLLRADRDGWYVPVAKGNEITWDGTEEYLRPSDIRRMVKDVLKRVIERASWLL
ncbi:MAG: hypothetical protein ACO2PM_14565 [Pyrobaculum sp.]|jgi:hypothetical protein